MLCSAHGGSRAHTTAAHHLPNGMQTAIESSARATLAGFCVASAGDFLLSIFGDHMCAWRWCLSRACLCTARKPRHAAALHAQVPPQACGRSRRIRHDGQASAGCADCCAVLQAAVLQQYAQAEKLFTSCCRPGRVAEGRPAGSSANPFKPQRPIDWAFLASILISFAGTVIGGLGHQRLHCLHLSPPWGHCLYSAECAPPVQPWAGWAVHRRRAPRNL